MKYTILRLLGALIGVTGFLLFGNAAHGQYSNVGGVQIYTPFADDIAAYNTQNPSNDQYTYFGDTPIYTPFANRVNSQQHRCYCPLVAGIPCSCNPTPIPTLVPCSPTPDGPEQYCDPRGPFPPGHWPTPLPTPYPTPVPTPPVPCLAPAGYCPTPTPGPIVCLQSNGIKTFCGYAPTPIPHPTIIPPQPVPSIDPPGPSPCIGFFCRMHHWWNGTR